MRRALLCAALAAQSSGFYLPGVAPKEYGEGERVEIKVNKLTSAKTQVRRLGRCRCAPAPLRTDA